MQCTLELKVISVVRGGEGQSNSALLYVIVEAWTVCAV